MVKSISKTKKENCNSQAQAPIQAQKHPYNQKKGEKGIMGLIRGEGRLLQEKYMKKFGVGKEEATNMVGDFIDELDEIKFSMKQNQKSEIEIKQKQQERFEEEFMKLYLE